MTTASPLFRLPRELREPIYEELFNAEKDIHFFTLCGELNGFNDILGTIEPLRALDLNRTTYREAICWWLNTRNFIFDGTHEATLAALNQFLVPEGIDFRKEIRSIEVWAWEKWTLENCVKKLGTFTNLRTVTVRLDKGSYLRTDNTVEMIRKNVRPPATGSLTIRAFDEDECVSCEEEVFGN